jgi:pyrimidine-nucleoside phosphorylase
MKNNLAPAWLIQKKRDGHELSEEEIQSFVQGLMNGQVADYQATAFLMAVYFRGMTPAETTYLTQAMHRSGDHYALKSVQGPKVDKHSTGGVGDKTSLILAPLAAACGLKVPMMAGRGLGHSGGTLDKLEAIPGFRVSLKEAEFEDALVKLGCAIIGQTQTIAPADRKLYSLRDVTATVDCIPLIVASILSKKLAEGTQALVLDVKVGNGAFMKTKTRATALSRALISTARKLGLECRVLLTDMSQPLGYAVGNSLEVIECIEILRNQKRSDAVSNDLKEVTLQLCAQMLLAGGVVKSLPAGRKLALQKLQDGSAWERFREMVRFQGGNVATVDDPQLLPQAKQKVVWKAPRKGFLSHFNTEEIGRILIELGGGRKKVTDPIDAGVGFVFHKKLGMKLTLDEPVVTVYAPEMSPERLTQLETRFWDAVGISSSRKPVPKLCLGLID